MNLCRIHKLTTADKKCLITDQTIEDFWKNEKFEADKFRSLYTLSSSSSDSKEYVEFAVITLISIAKCTSFFGENFDLEQLSQNNDAVFVGSILLKLAKIKSLNCRAVSTQFNFHNE